MKKVFCLLLFTTCFGLSAYSSVQAFLNYAIFYAPGKGSYVEMYLDVAGSSVLFKRQKLIYEAKIHIEINFKQNDSLVLKRGYDLLSPEMPDTIDKPNFLDAQRYVLKPGTYLAEI